MTTNEEARQRIINELRWLADKRDEYSTDMLPQIHEQAQTARQLADILERKTPVVDGGEGWGWLPSWRWDEWDAMAAAPDHHAEAGCGYSCHTMGGSHATPCCGAPAGHQAEAPSVPVEGDDYIDVIYVPAEDRDAAVDALIAAEISGVLYREHITNLSRLAARPVVDDAAVERAMVAAEALGPLTPIRDRIRAALVAALGTEGGAQ